MSASRLEKSRSSATSSTLEGGADCGQELSEVLEVSKESRWKSLQKFWGVMAKTKETGSGGSTPKRAVTRAVSIRSLRGCTKCARPYDGFGEICSDCRKAPKRGTAKLCLVCRQFYSGFGTLCEDCREKNLPFGQEKTEEDGGEDDKDDKDEDEDEPFVGSQSFSERILARQRALPLLYAVCIGDAQEVHILLRSGTDVNQENHEGVTPLICACAIGNEGLVDLLIAHRADPDKSDTFGATPLHAAAFDSNLTIVKACLKAGCEADALDVEDCSPLHLAVQTGHTDEHLEVVATLLSFGASPVSIATDGSTPLSTATTKGLDKTRDMLKEAYERSGRKRSSAWTM